MNYKHLVKTVLFGLMWSMKVILVVLLGTFVAVEAAHLNYHAQSERSERFNCPKPQLYVDD